MGEETAMREMPKYKCHKKVRALKIDSIVTHGDGAIDLMHRDGYGPTRVTAEWMKRHKPEVGGYYVLYEDGYESFSPAHAFESGYTEEGIEVPELQDRFRHHPPKDDAIAAMHGAVRHGLHEVAQNLNAMLPDGREKALVMTKLEEAMFWANAAIARAGAR